MATRARAFRQGPRIAVARPRRHAFDEEPWLTLLACVGLSVYLHGVFIVLAKVLPFLLALLLRLLPHPPIQAALEQPKPLQIVVIEKPKPVVVQPVETIAALSQPPTPKAGSKKRRAHKLERAMGIITILGSSKDAGAIADVFATSDVAALGGLVGTERVEGSFGGLGLRGGGTEGGGGTGLGLGGLGVRGPRRTAAQYTHNVSDEELRQLLGDKPLAQGRARTVVRLAIDAGGNVTSVSLIDNPTPELADAARAYGMKMKFKPARDEEDRPCATSLVWTIRWSRG